MKNGSQLVLFNIENPPIQKWPKLSEFPLNDKFTEGHNVEKVIYNDIGITSELLILTGFTSLSYLIDTFGNNEYSKIKKVKVILGFEPNIRGRKRYHVWPLEKEIKEYWLKEGLSILSGGSVINLIEKIKSGWIQFYFYNKLHAKIYLFDNTAILGSSNFSSNGLVKQIEANIRVNRIIEPEKYNDVKLIAENYLDKALPYDKITELLKSLIQEVDWKDALARAMNEVLEGEWLNEYRILTEKLANTKLWPTQRRGLAQALSILQRNNNVLIADPTGAGKTKLCSAIILALKNWLYVTGRAYKDNSLIVCPPLVIEKWQKEFSNLSTINNNQISNGILSRGGKANSEKAVNDLNQVSILAIDEAHNYLNYESNRSKLIRKNNADFKLLITATPINKKIDDLLTIIELLDIDNLDDENFKIFKDLKTRPDKLDEISFNKLREFISNFTLRRTKDNINNQIAEEPELYKNALGEKCKFPVQNSLSYKTLETNKDKEIVDEIMSLCKKLKGLTYLNSIKKPKFEFQNLESAQGDFNKRINAAKALSIYMIRSRLRSSHVALIEHISGLDAVKKFINFPIKKSVKNKIKTIELEKLINKNSTPQISNYYKNVEKPKWLIEKESYKKVCISEKLIYEKIAILSKKLSGNRELGKANHLLKLSFKHKKSLAFDSSIITLSYLKHLINNKNGKVKVLVATGSNKIESEEVLKKFNLKSSNKERIIALCSDKMAEGVDLQLASCLTLLDLPSVIRIVEQRFGRIDRMDTSHNQIDLYWPDDSEAFSLKGDRRLINLNQLVTKMWGSNFQAPSSLKEKHFSQLDSGIKGIIEEFNQFITQDDTWEGIEDSFQPVLDLKNKKNGLITEEEYSQYKRTETSVKTKVSFLKSINEWCFIAIRGNELRSPKWFFINSKEGENEIFTEFSAICSNLRMNISNKSMKAKWNEKYLAEYLNIFKENEINLLPPKKKRALEVAYKILKKKSRYKSLDIKLKDKILDLLKLFEMEQNTVDNEVFSELWIDLLQPYIDDKRLRNRSRKNVYNLSSLTTPTEIKKINFSIKDLEKILDDVPVYERIDHRIAACIVGVPYN